MAQEPIIVSLWADKDRKKFLCSGLLLTGQYILTVKHAFENWPEGQPVYVRLIDGVDADVEAKVLQSHREFDAAILQLPTAVKSPAPPNLQTRGNSNLDGKAAVLWVIDPDSFGRSNPTNYSIANFDHRTGEYVLSPENAKGHSGGMVEVEGKLVGILSRRKATDPLCRAVAMHLLWHWLEIVLHDGAHARDFILPSDGKSPSDCDHKPSNNDRWADSGIAEVKHLAAMPAAAEQRRFRVALSFSGEQRNFVEAVAKVLVNEFGQDAVFFYPSYQHETNGVGNLAQQVPDFYLAHADLTAPFISASYQRSDACMAEWRAVRELIYTRQHSRLMLFRFDRTPMEGLHSYDCYTEVPDPGPEEIAQLLIRRWHLNHGLQMAGRKGPEAYLEALRSVIGDRALSLVKSGALEKLRSVGGFLKTPLPISESPDVSNLVSALHLATKKCFPAWRGEFGHSLDLVRDDCRMLLGKLLKLSIKKPVSGTVDTELALASPGQLTLACRLMGSAVTAYCAWNDLPLLFEKAIGGGFDAAPRGMIDLRDLASGGKLDVANDIHEAAWEMVRGRPSGLTAWTEDHKASLKSYIALHWKRDRKSYLLMTDPLGTGELNPAFGEVAQSLSLGLVVRSADGLSDLMRIGEEDLVALVCDYLQLLESL